MRPRMTICAMLVASGAPWGPPAPAAAQAPFTFRYQPRAGTAVRLIVETQSELVVVGVPGLRDSAVVDVLSLGGLTRRATPVGDGRFALSVTYDSLRTRLRVDSATWRDGVFATREPVEAQFTIAPGMVLGDPSYVGDSAMGRSVRGALGALHVVLPTDPVEVGGEWRSEVVLPIAVEVPADTVGVVMATLTGPVAGVLDSVVPRGGDTLAYLSAHGRYAPTTVNSTLLLGGGPAAAELWGEFVAKLIWSTAWNAFVSVVQTSRVNQRFEAAPESGVEDARITAIIVTRVRVRP
jgi:hypothetical protein